MSNSTKTSGKWIRNVVIVLIMLVIGGIYYYIELPAINLHSPGMWNFLLSEQYL